MQQRFELRLGRPCHGRESTGRERPAEDGRVLHQPALLGRQTVEACCDEGLESFGDLERLDLAGQTKGVAFTYEQTAVDEHPDCLDGVEGDAFRALEDAGP